MLLAEKEQFARHLFNLLMFLSGQGDLASFGIPFPGGDANEQRTHHVRRLAQWAINVVDFGDSDSVMTRLRYDVNPFNEHEVFDAAGNVIDTTDMGVVWGMEYPELVLTETLAFHDRRAEDSDIGGGTLNNGDTDLDSIVEPEGAAFFELFFTRHLHGSGGPWHHVASASPEDAYRANAFLDLGRRNGLKPAWRLAIGEIMDSADDSPASLVDNNRAYQNTFEPVSGFAEGQGLNLKLTRFVWFCDTPPTKVDDEEDTQNTFYNLRQIPPSFQTSNYFVVGSDNIVEVGLTKNRLPSPQKISVAGDGKVPQTIARGDHRRVYDDTDRRLRPTVPSMFAMVAESDLGVGVNVSEPLGGYSSDSSPTPLDANASSPIAEDLSTRTELNFRTVFLQRLADASAPWNPPEGHARHDPRVPVNPYRTIDWMPMDITIFNSLYDGDDDPDDPRPNRPLRRFASREKCGVLPDNRLLQEDRFNIWSAWTNLAPRVAADRRPGAAVTVADDPDLPGNLVHSCNTNVTHSLGWLNRSFDHVGVIGDGLDHYRTKRAYSEAPFTPLAANGLAEGSSGDPQTGLASTYPTLVWHNRPYANPYELMLVPACSSSSRAAEFTVSTPVPPYKGGAPLNDAFAYRGPFGHLLNFFHSSAGAKNEHEVPELLGGNYFRLFDFVSVSSPFKGTKRWYASNQNAWAALLWNNDPRFLDATSPLGLATNPATLSELREPGKINLNTAVDIAWDHVGFDSLLKSWDTPTGVLTRAQEFELSMAGGYKPIVTESLATQISGRYPNGQHPAEYPNPLRSGIGGDLLARISGPTRPAVDGTMLRGSADAANRQPILGRYALAPPTSAAQATAYSLQNRRTNPYFRFKDLMKLGNSVTSQSNVYAIWITIGYFEIEPNVHPETGELFAMDPAHPDGYRFGIEMGSDVGQVTRHRAFYVVDRSIPVAFEPGRNHNVEKAVMLRRHLE